MKETARENHIEFLKSISPDTDVPIKYAEDKLREKRRWLRVNDGDEIFNIRVIRNRYYCNKERVDNANKKVLNMWW
jgi:hypothetical protein